MASVEQNIATSKKFNEMVSKDKSLKWVDEIVGPQFKWHDATAPDLPGGPEGVKTFLTAYLAAFPDMKLSIVDAFGAGDKVATRWVAEGTHTGPLEGNAPTGKKFKSEGITIDAYDADGKIIESWNGWDSHSMLEQLGLAGEAPEKKEKKDQKAEAEQRPGVQ